MVNVKFKSARHIQENRFELVVVSTERSYGLNQSEVLLVSQELGEHWVKQAVFPPALT